MTNKEKLALLDAALQNDAVEWKMDEIDERLDAFYPDGDDQYPDWTEYCISHQEDGNWVLFRDFWYDTRNHIITDWGRLCKVG